MKRTPNKVTVKTQVTIRRDMWEKISGYMDNPTQPSKIVYEALRRFWEELNEREEKQLRARLGRPSQLN